MNARGIFAVFGRELAERRLLALMALLGLVPLLAPLPNLPPSARDDAREAIALGLAAGVAALLAVVLGASVFGRDLSERRLGFYFARPLPGWAIWAGKIAAAWVLAFGIGMAVLLPAIFVVNPGILRVLASGPRGASIYQGLLIPLALLALLLLAHTVSLMVRSRSPLLAADVAGLALVTALAGWTAGRLLDEGAIGRPLVTVAIGLAAAAFLALVAASAVQVTRGRTDLRRNHLLLSLTLWGGLLAAALGFAGYSAWVLSAGPSDVVRLAWSKGASSGSWVSFEGMTGTGFSPAFLLNASSGRYLRLPGATPELEMMPPEVCFSADGRRAVWIAAGKGGNAIDLVTLDLARPGAVPARPPVGFKHRPLSLDLSPDGTLLAALEASRLTVMEVDTGRLVATAPWDWWSRRGMAEVRFAGPRTVRVYAGEPKGAGSAVEELDLATGRLSVVGTIPGPPSSYYPSWSVSPRGDAAVVGDGRGGLLLADLGNSEPRARLRPPRGGKLRGWYLQDGRLAVLLRQGRERQIWIAGPDGTVRQRFRFPGAMDVWPGGQPAPDLLLLATAPDRAADQSGWTLRLLDLRTGSVRELGKGTPVLRGEGRPGSVASSLVFAGEGRFLRLDPATGRLVEL